MVAKKTNIDPRTQKILEELGINTNDPDTIWEIHGTSVIRHRAVELAGAKKGIVINSLEEVETNSEQGIAVIKCTASLGDRKVITYGEASPKNNRAVQYPYAMAEKRAVDRAYLKLIGVHGFVYSEDEIDDRKPINSMLDSLEINPPGQRTSKSQGTAKANTAKTKVVSPGGDKAGSNGSALENEWEFRRLRGDAHVCQDVGEFKAKIRQSMSDIDNSNDFANKSKVDFLKQLWVVNDLYLEKMKLEHNNTYELLKLDHRRFIENLEVV